MCPPKYSALHFLSLTSTASKPLTFTPHNNYFWGLPQSTPLKIKTLHSLSLTFLFPLTSHRLARTCSEQCLELCITSTSCVCLPLYIASLIAFLNCKSLWIKASAKWVNVSVPSAPGLWGLRGECIGYKIVTEYFISAKMLKCPGLPLGLLWLGITLLKTELRNKTHVLESILRFSRR